MPLLAVVYGAKSLDTVATSIALGSFTVSAITLAILEAGRDKSGKGFSSRQIALSLLRSVKKPIVWAPLVGLAFSCAGLHLPSYMDASLAVLGSAASGSALVLTGLVVSSQKFEFGRNTLFTVFLKNALQPGLARLRQGLRLKSEAGQLWPDRILRNWCGHAGLMDRDPEPYRLK